MRARRMVGIVLLGAGAVLVLVLLATAFVLFTTPGAKLALSVANGRDLPVRARSIQGSLAGRFEIHGLEVRTGTMEASADTVIVAWLPLALRLHRVDVTDVTVAGVHVVIRPSAPDSLRVKEMRDQREKRGATWKITALRVRVRAGSLDAPGDVHLRDVSVAASGSPDGYHGEVRATGAAWRVDDARLFVRGSGSEQAFTADSLDVRALDGVIRGDAFVRWTPGLSWRARLEGDSLRAGLLAAKPEEWPGTASFRARGTGFVNADTTRIGIDVASLEGMLRGRPLSARGRVDVDGRRIAASDARVSWGSARATLSGHMAETADVTLDAIIPALSEIAPHARGAARVQGRITGTPARFEVALNASGKGVRAARFDVPDLDATLNAVVSAHDYVPHAVEVRRADVRLANGKVAMTGRCSWQDGIAWNATIAADHFETSLLTPARWKLYGPVSLRATTSGLRRGKQLAAQVAIASLSGMLRDRSLSGAGSVAVKNHEADISGLHVEWGGTHLRANGRAGKTLDLDLDLVAPDLAALVPSWRGSVSVQGSARGPRLKPTVAATITADSVRVRDYALNHLDGHVNADLAFASPADVQLTALGVSSGETTIDTVRVSVSGPRDGHTASIVATRSDARASMTLRGAYADSAWTGWIEDLRVRQDVAGEWHTDRRAPIHASASRISVDSLVVVSKGAHIAAAGSWQRGGRSRATMELDDFPLATFQRFLATGLSIAGTLNGNATLAFDSRNGLDARVDLVPGPGEVSLSGEKLGYSGHITGRADSSGVSARVDFNLTHANTRTAVVTGEISIPGFVAGRDSLGAQPLEGSINAECADIGPVLAVFAPALLKSSGKFSAQLTPKGTAGDFRIVGRAALEKARFDLARGLRLRDTEITMSSDGEGRVSLDGGMTSGGGRVTFQASSARSENGWVTGTFTVKGERFQLINQPDAQVFLSPDLQVNLADRVAVATGSVRVPYARIETTQVPASAVSPSNDVVIVEDTLATKRALQVRTQVRVVLGDSVTFNGFGLRGRLAGSLMVDDERGRPTRGTGEIQIVDGKYRAFGSELTIDPGRLVFGGGPVDNPGIDVRAYRGLTTQNVMGASSGDIVGMNLRGTLRKPEFSVFSNPPMSESEIMSCLLTGRAPATSSSGEQSALAGAVSMIGMQQGSQLAGDLGKKLSVDAYLEAGAEAHETSFVAGKYLSPKLYVSYAAGLFDNTNTFRARYSLARKWTLQAESGKYDSTDLLYWFERGK